MKTFLLFVLCKEKTKTPRRERERETGARDTRERDRETRARDTREIESLIPPNSWVKVGNLPWEKNPGREKKKRKTEKFHKCERFKKKENEKNIKKIRIS